MNGDGPGHEEAEYEEEDDLDDEEDDEDGGPEYEEDDETTRRGRRGRGRDASTKRMSRTTATSPLP